MYGHNKGACINYWYAHVDVVQYTMTVWCTRSGPLLSSDLQYGTRCVTYLPRPGVSSKPDTRSGRAIVSLVDRHCWTNCLRSVTDLPTPSLKLRFSMSLAMSSTASCTGGKRLAASLTSEHRQTHTCSLVPRPILFLCELGTRETRA